MSTAPNVCRRCKKKRSPDETEATLKFRTCKPCREIERKKKRMKKLSKLNANGEGVPVEVHSSGAVPSGAAIGSGANSAGNSGVVGSGNASSNAAQLSAQDSLNEKIINIANQASLQSQQQTYERQTPQLHQGAQHHHHHHQQQQQHLGQQAKQEEKEIPIDESLLREGQTGNDHELPSDKVDEKHQDAENQKKVRGGGGGDLAAEGNEAAEDDKSKAGDFSATKEVLERALQNANKLIDSTENKDPNADYCLYCGVLRDVNDNGRYKLCGNCVDNPLESNVCNDFGEYLGRIQNGKFTDVKNLIFLKKIDELDETIPVFKQYENSNETSNVDETNSSIIKEKNNLNDIMFALTNNFINPVIIASGFKFSKGSSNLSAKPFPKAIKVLYKCKQDVKTTQRSSNNSTTNNNNLSSNTPSTNSFRTVDPSQPHQLQSPSVVNNRKMKTENCNSNMYVSYDIYGRNLNIKYSHNTHKTYIEKLYSKELIDIVGEELAVHDDLEKIFGHITAADFHHMKTFSQDLRLELSALKKPNFVRDFSSS